MKHLRYIPLPGGGLIAWAHRGWVLRILAPDSRKKKVIRTLAQLRILDLVARRFDGSVALNGRRLDINRLILALSTGAKTATPLAVFVNSRRAPPRIYAWLQSGDENLFVKIGTALDKAAFRNEFKVATKVSAPSGITLMRPIKLVEADGLFLLLSQGLSPEILDAKSRMEPHDIFSYLSALTISPTAPFGGPVHCDLTSNNVFAHGDGILVIDWEFAALSGPEHCDLVGLAAELSARNSTLASFEATRTYLRNAANLDLDQGDVIACLSFLAARGNPRAQALLSYEAERETATGGLVT